MISNNLSTSERWAALYKEAGKLAEFCQVLFVLLVSHADDHGRLKGTPFTVKHLVVPTSPRSIDTVERALIHLHRVKLIQWYDHEDGKYIQINKFGDHQSLKGHEDRPSKYPDPPKIAQRRPELPKYALREEKGTKEKGTKENLSGVETTPTPTRDFLAWFVDEYKARRHGARYLVKPKHGGIVKQLLVTIPPERLRQHATILLTATADDWIEETDRGIEVLAGKINWLEERLCAWEVKRKAREAV